MKKKIDTDVSNLKQGLQPQNLSFWYDKIIKETIEMAPPWLQDKIKVNQDPILPMKFNLDISKRAVRYFMIVVDNNFCLLYTSPSPRDATLSRMPSSA